VAALGVEAALVVEVLAPDVVETALLGGVLAVLEFLA
jgi:hypothetical protein